MDENRLATCNMIVAKEIACDGDDIRIDFVLSKPTKELIKATAIVMMFRLGFAEHKGRPAKTTEKFSKYPRTVITSFLTLKACFVRCKLTKYTGNLLHFLWWPNSDTAKEPQEYTMIAHLFGVMSSPSCVNLGLKTIADDEFGMTAANFHRSYFYMEDGFKSVAKVQ